MFVCLLSSADGKHSAKPFFPTWLTPMKRLLKSSYNAFNEHKSLSSLVLCSSLHQYSIFFFFCWRSKLHVITNWQKQIQIKLISSTIFFSFFNNYYKHLYTVTFERKPIFNIKTKKQQKCLAQHRAETKFEREKGRERERPRDEWTSQIKIPIGLCKRTKTIVNIFGQ